MGTDALSRLDDLLEHRPPRCPTATAFVVESLREGILGGALPEGLALRQDELAARFRVSRMPIREALRLLEARGLVEFSPHRGAVVAPLPIAEVRELYEIRAALEALALRRSIPALTPEAFERAATLLSELDVETDLVRAIVLHRRFHLTLYAGAGKRLLGLIEAQLDASERYLRLELVEMDNAAESQEEHRALLAACRAGDAARAVALLEPHIVEAGWDLAAALEQVRGGAP